MVFIRALENRLRVRLSDLINTDFGERWLKSRPIPEFYKQMLVWFRNVCPVKVPDCGKEVRHQVIWHNKAIRVDNRTLFHRRLASAGISLIDDFVDARGAVLDYQAFLNQHGIRINPLVYLGWCRAIPNSWRRLLMGSHQLSIEERAAAPSIFINGKDMQIVNV